MNRPLITIQCGNYSNHVGSHFGNRQESGFVYTTDSQNTARSASYPEEVLEVDNDILYREGLTLDKEGTFTPRLNTNSRQIVREQGEKPRLDRRCLEVQDAMRLRKQQLLRPIEGQLRTSSIPVHPLRSFPLISSSIRSAPQFALHSLSPLPSAALPCSPSLYSIDSHRKVLKIRVDVLGSTRNVSPSARGSTRCSPQPSGESKKKSDGRIFQTTQLL